MTKHKKDERCSDIIRAFYYGKYDNETAVKIREEFANWFFDGQNTAEKEIAIREFEIPQEGDAGLWTEAELHEIRNRIIASKSANISVVLKRKLSFAKIAARVAAVVLPLIVLAGAWMILQNGGESNSFIAEYEVPYGKVEEQTLGDSSLVTVNSGSKLVVSQNKNERTVELVGESYFSVTKDADRLFVVKTQDLTVTVLGTEFNVEAYPDNDVTIVTLNRGKVAVKTINNQSYTLEPNQQFVYTRSTGAGVVKSLDQFKAEEAAEWKHGMLVLYDEPLSSALRTIERRYNITVEVAPGTKLDDVLMSKFDERATLDEVMACIKDVVPSLNYKIENNKLIISKK